MSRSTEPPPPTTAKGSTLGAASAWSVFEFLNFCGYSMEAHASWESFSYDSFELDEGSVSGCGADAGRNRPHMAQMKRQIFLWARSTSAPKLLGTVATHFRTSHAVSLPQPARSAWLLGLALRFHGGASAVSPGIEFLLCVQSSLPGQLHFSTLLLPPFVSSHYS